MIGLWLSGHQKGEELPEVNVPDITEHSHAVLTP